MQRMQEVTYIFQSYRCSSPVTDFVLYMLYLLKLDLYDKNKLQLH